MKTPYPISVIHLVGAITTELAAYFLPAFAELDQKPQKNGILVRMMTSGGDATAGLGMYDLMVGANNRVVIEVYGECSSIGITMLQAGHLRFVSPSTRALVHNGSLDTDGHMPGKHLASAAKEIKRLDAYMQRLISGRSGASLKMVKQWCENETVFDANELVAHGLADAIIQPKGS